MRKKIEEYIINNYNELSEISKKITKGNELSDDLLQEVLLMILEKDNIVLDNTDDNTIKYFITGIMRINWFSSTSPFYYRIRKERNLYNEIYDNIEIEDFEYDWEKDKKFEILENELSKIDIFRLALFELYLIVGSLKKVSKQTGISVTNVALHINYVKNKIKEAIKNK